MLSYQHIYHAGNLADVHKHALLSVMIDYLTRKDKPLTYMETHSGRGLYELNDEAALKTGEAAAGIERIRDLGWFDKNHPYSTAIAAVHKAHGKHAYPGSPIIAANLLRPIDSIQLCELHPQEFAALRQNIAPHGGILYNKDGLQMSLALAPPNPRRGMLLIDPSWEVKTDYETVPRVIGQVARKWNVGVIALWYPIFAPTVASAPAQRQMVRQLTEAHPEALVSEVSFPPAREGHGMIGSGMFVINAPWGLENESNRLRKLFNKL